MQALDYNLTLRNTTTGGTERSHAFPTISSFFGIHVRIYYDDHAPPHFHAYYGAHVATFELSTLRVLAGRMPRRAAALILEWAAEHREELAADWTRARRHEPLVAIAPLE